MAVSSLGIETQTRSAREKEKRREEIKKENDEMKWIHHKSTMKA